jgi:pilus assembly protein Flp/PilA
MLATLFQSNHGATAIEYGLIAALIALVAIVAFQLMGTALFAIFDHVASQL